MASWRIIALGAALAASALAGGAGAYAVVTRPALGVETPAAGATVTSASPLLLVAARNGTGLRQVVASVDGRAVVPELRADAVVLAAHGLAEGRHSVHLEAELPGPLGGRVARTWSFVVDTRPPPITFLTPGNHWSSTQWLLGRSEPGASVAIAWPGGGARQTVGADGTFRVLLPIPPGRTSIRLTARDRAGNERNLTRTVGYDPDPPVLTEPAWPAVSRATASPVLTLAVTDLTPLVATVTVDGDSFHPDVVKGGFQLRFHDLPQGLHQIAMRVVDRGGHAVEVSRSLLVDSTEVLAPGLTLMPGARGNDVVSLTRRLRLEGAWPYRRLDRVYDRRVVAAVRRYQARHAMAADGIARPALLAQTQGKLVIVKHEFRLRAYRDGRLVAVFPIAIGQPRYPSPTGTFAITEKLKNPTWIPPNSPWAKGLEPIPPGAGNPLGTRWIGTSAPAVGIHGTPNDASIGTAASHGCIRMHIPDVERLFDLVDVGETVQFIP
jgi:lipoprotein-anchoring transpeptidase ErfK/SrfK